MRASKAHNSHAQRSRKTIFAGPKSHPTFSTRSDQTPPLLSFPGYDWFSPILHGNGRICANCRHWDLHYKACLPRLENGQLHFDIAAPCAVGAVTTNAGDCVPMLGENGSCVGHADLFAPSDDYLNEMQEHQAESEESKL